MNVHVARLSAALGVTSVNEVVADNGSAMLLALLTELPKIRGWKALPWRNGKASEW